MSKYCWSCNPAPIELVMLDNEIKATSIYSPPPPELIWDPYEPQISSNPIHSPSSVVFALQQLGYDGGFYDPQAARRRAKENVDRTSTLSTTADWLAYPYVVKEGEIVEEGEHPHVAQLHITSRRGYRFTTPVILTLPSPYVLPRFSLFKQLFRERYAQQLLSSVWRWKHFQELNQFTPTAITIMTGYFLQRTQDPLPIMSPESSFASFLSYWSSVNEMHKDIIISVCDPKQLLQSPPTRRTSNFSDSGRESAIITEPSFGQPQPIYWGSHPLIIRDPYAITQNHAEGVSMKQLNRFASSCQDTLKRMNAGEITIFAESKAMEKTRGELLPYVDYHRRREQTSFLAFETCLNDLYREIKTENLAPSPLETADSNMSPTSWDLLVSASGGVRNNEDEDLILSSQRSDKKVYHQQTNERGSAHEMCLEAENLARSLVEAARSNVLPMSTSTLTKVIPQEEKFERSPVEAAKSNVPPISLTSTPTTPSENGAKEEDGSFDSQPFDHEYHPAKTLSQPDKIPCDDPTSNNRDSSAFIDSVPYISGLEDQEAAFVDRIAHRDLLPLAAHRSDGEQQPDYLPGYEEYEAAFVDEAFAAALSSPSSYLLVPLSLIPLKVPAKQKKTTKAVSSPEQIELDINTLALVRSADVDPDVETEDIAFLTQIMANAAVAEGNQRRVLNKMRDVLKEKYGHRYGVEPFGSSRRLSRWLNNGGFKVLQEIPKATVPIGNSPSFFGCR
ncbi:hypothetical protein C0995_012167 [Termitomyces sp. Mi166|nr:hypothetical protein C0995_012167 [Termitomyces sp. Mi166\